jgi:hypothetical protein
VDTIAPDTTRTAHCNDRLLPHYLDAPDSAIIIPDIDRADSFVSVYLNA